MKTYISLILAFSFACMFTSCYDEADWLGDNTTTEGKLFPVIAGWQTLNGSTFQSGESIQLDLDFWSVDPIEEIRLIEKIDGTSRVVQTFGYTPNFQEDSQTDELLMTYTAPQVDEQTTIILAAEVVNENGLTRITPDPGVSIVSGTVNAVRVTVEQ